MSGHRWGWISLECTRETKMAQYGNMDDMDRGDHGNMNNDASAPSHAEMMSMMYDTLIINGKASPAIENIQMSKGDIIKLRFINTGLFTQVIGIARREFKVIHYDGQPINKPELISIAAIRDAPAVEIQILVQLKRNLIWYWEQMMVVRHSRLTANKCRIKTFKA